jgi:hypothetical protein
LGDQPLGHLGMVAPQAGFDIAQALAIGPLRKSHSPKRLGATEAPHAAIAAITGHAAGKRGPRKKIHPLRKQHLADVSRCLQSKSLETESDPIQIDTT